MNPKSMSLRHNVRRLKLGLTVLLSGASLVAWAPRASAQDAPAGLIALHLQERNPTTGEPTTRVETIDPHKVAIVIVDMWNFHWCMTSSERVGALVPRMKRVLEAAHQMGMTLLVPFRCGRQLRRHSAARSGCQCPPLPFA